jgi:hypothetical protein
VAYPGESANATTWESESRPRGRAASLLHAALPFRGITESESLLPFRVAGVPIASAMPQVKHQNIQAVRVANRSIQPTVVIPSYRCLHRLRKFITGTGSSETASMNARRGDGLTRNALTNLDRASGMLRLYSASRPMS